MVILLIRVQPTLQYLLPVLHIIHFSGSVRVAMWAISIFIPPPHREGAATYLIPTPQGSCHTLPTHTSQFLCYLAILPFTFVPFNSSQLGKKIVKIKEGYKVAVRISEGNRLILSNEFLSTIPSRHMLECVFQ